MIYFTVTDTVTVLLFHLPLIDVVPLLTAVMVPEAFTFATEDFELVQTTLPVTTAVLPVSYSAVATTL
jgi:hypothetical protein